MSAMEQLNTFNEEISTARRAVDDACDACSTRSSAAQRRAVADAYSHLEDVYARAGTAVAREMDGGLLSEVLIDAQASAREKAKSWNRLADNAARREADTTGGAR